jgi:hypothetical protein
VLRAEIIDGVRLLGGGATEKCSAVDNNVDPAHGGRQGIRIKQVAHDELDMRFA